MSRKSLSEYIRDPKFYMPGGAVLALVSFALLKKAAEHPKYGWPVTAGIALLGAVVARWKLAPKGIGTSPMAKAAAFNRERMLTRGFAALKAQGSSDVVAVSPTGAVVDSPTSVVSDPVAAQSPAVSPATPPALPRTPLQAALSNSGLLLSASPSSSASPVSADGSETDDAELYGTPTMGLPR